MKTLVLILGVTLAGAACAQTIDLSAAHDTPLPAATEASASPAAHGLRHELEPTMTRVVMQPGPDGKMQAVCHVESNPAAIAAAMAKHRNQAGRKE